MRRRGIQEGEKEIGSGRTISKLCGLLIAALLVGGMPSGITVSTYAAENNNLSQDGAKNGLPEVSILDYEPANRAVLVGVKDAAGTKNGEEEDGGKEVQPTPTKKPKKTPTPLPKGEKTDAEEGVDEKDIENGDNGEESPDNGENPGKEASPTPTKKPKKTPTPTPKSEKPDKGETSDVGDGEDGEKADGDSSEDAGKQDDGEASPTPTKKPKKTPTPTPKSEKPDKGETPDVGDGEDGGEAEGDSSEDADNQDDGEASPTPTKKPKKTPTPTPKSEKPDKGETPDGGDGEDGEKEEGDSSTDLENPGDEEATPTKKPDKTPTPAPTKKPSQNPAWAVPTQSDDARYQYLLGIDAKVISIDDPPAGYRNATEAAKNMKTITIPIWKMTASGGRYTSSAKLTVNKKLARNVQEIFKEIYALDIKFPIKVVKGFMYRKVGGVALSKSRIMSIHSFGAAIDINPGDYDNDYFLGKGNDLRDKSNPYCIPDEVIAIFEKYGWFWGGNFEICADTMHFQYFELGMLTYQGNSPFRNLKVTNSYMTGSDVRNLQQRLRELGFSVSVDGVYGNKTADAIRRYQKSRGLNETGEMDYKTWETIINETHYMAYVF